MDVNAPHKGCLFTIGHSTINFDVFCDALRAFGVEKLIDVRSHPGSRYVPHFNKECLPAQLGKYQIEYSHFPRLGGRRKSYCKDDYTLVDGWKNESFRNYASYTLTVEYDQGIAELITEAKKKTVCIMCAESVPWRCHRLIISNTLLYRGVEVYHIMSETQCIRHELGKYGALIKISDGKIIYPKL